MQQKPLAEVLKTIKDVESYLISNIFYQDAC